MGFEEGADPVDRTLNMSSFASLDTSTTSTRTGTTVGTMEDAVAQEYPALPAHAIESGSNTRSDNKLIGATVHLRRLRGDDRRKLSDLEVEQKVSQLIANLAGYTDAPQRPEDLYFVKKIKNESVQKERLSSTIYRQGKCFYKRVAETKQERDALIKKYFNQNQKKPKPKEQDAQGVMELATNEGASSAIDMEPAPEVSVSPSHFCLRMFTNGKRVQLAEYCQRYGIRDVRDHRATRNMDILLRCAGAAEDDMNDEEMVRYFFDFIEYFWPQEGDGASLDIDDDDGDDNEVVDVIGDGDNLNDYEGIESRNYDEDEDDESNFSEDECDPGSNDGYDYVTGDTLVKSLVLQAVNVLSCKNSEDGLQSPPSLKPPCSMPSLDNYITAASLNQKDTNVIVVRTIASKLTAYLSDIADTCAKMLQLSLLKNQNDDEIVPSDQKDDAMRTSAICLGSKDCDEEVKLRVGLFRRETNPCGDFEQVLLSGPENGKLETVDICMQQNVDVNTQDSSGWTALHLSSKNGHSKVAQYLVKDANDDIGTKSNDEWTTLHVAVDDRNLNVKANVEAKQKDEWTALHFAVHNGHLEMVKRLMRDGKTDVNAKSNDGWTALHFAVHNGHLEMVKRLIRDGKADVNSRNNDGCTALHFAGQNGHLEMVYYLLWDGKVGVNAKSNDGCTALHFASKNGHLEVVKYLVRHGMADVDATQKDEWTALHLASNYGHLEVVQYLVQHGKADVEAKQKDEWTALHLASNYGHFKVVQYLVQYGKADVDAKQKDEWTALHLASTHGHLEVVQYLIRDGMADVEAKQKDEWTALHLASNYGHLEVVQYLVRYGMADIDAKQKDEWTALHLASSYGHLEVVQYLVQHGKAGANAKSNDGCTTLHFASKKRILRSGPILGAIWHGGCRRKTEG